MKAPKTTIMTWFSVAIFLVLSLFPSFSMAGTSQIEVLIKVTNDGFFDAEGKSSNNLMKVPKNRKIKLTFEHVGKPGEEHAFVLLFDSSDEEIESGTINGQNKFTHIEFTTGEAGEIYDVFCVLPDCDGMEHLIDLIIMAI